MNVFKFAMQMEKDGEIFYREMASKTVNKGIARIMNMLADDELKHYKKLDNMRKHVSSGMAQSEVLTKTRNIFKELRDLGNPFANAGQQVDLYKKAWDIEKKSLDFYLQQAKDAVEKEVKDVFAMIADEEKMHAHLLDNIIQFISRPQTWVEDAEFYHLEEY